MILVENPDFVVPSLLYNFVILGGSRGRLRILEEIWCCHDVQCEGILLTDEFGER